MQWWHWQWHWYWHVSRIANFHSDNFLLGLSSRTLLDSLLQSVAFPPSNCAYIVFCCGIRKQQRQQYICTLSECFRKHYGEQMHCTKTGHSKDGREQEKTRNKMVNHKTQFTIDFIGDKNLLEFYTHYIMQRRFVVVRQHSTSREHYCCRFVVSSITTATTIRRSFTPLHPIVRNVWYAFSIKIILQWSSLSHWEQIYGCWHVYTPLVWVWAWFWLENRFNRSVLHGRLALESCQQRRVQSRAWQTHEFPS